MLLVGLVVNLRTEFEAWTFTGCAHGRTASVTGLSAASQCFHWPKIKRSVGYFWSYQNSGFEKNQRLWLDWMVWLRNQRTNGPLIILAFVLSCGKPSSLAMPQDLKLKPGLVALFLGVFKTMTSARVLSSTGSVAVQPKIQNRGLFDCLFVLRFFVRECLSVPFVVGVFGWFFVVPFALLVCVLWICRRGLHWSVTCSVLGFVISSGLLVGLTIRFPEVLKHRTRQILPQSCHMF